MKPFAAPRESIGHLDADLTAHLIAAAADVALILDREGTVLDIAFGTAEPSLDQTDTWLGRPWTDTVTSETRPKVEALLSEAQQGGQPRWRQVNHPVRGHPDTPVDYCVVPIGSGTRLLAVGRDLSGVATVQRRLVEVQHSLENEYWQLRQAESRYRVLFQLSGEPVLMVDAASRRIREANPAAERWLGGEQGQLVGQRLPGTLERASADAVQRQLDILINVGQADDVEVESRGVTFRVAGSLLRQRSGDLVLLRLTPQPLVSAGPAEPDEAQHGELLNRAVTHSQDALAVTDPEGRILRVNRAFLELAELSHEEQAEQRTLDRWLGREGVDIDVLLSNLRRHGSMPLYATVLRGQHGAVTQVEVSASAFSLTGSSQRNNAFFIRNVDVRPHQERAPADENHAISVAELTKMVGQMPLKDLVRESTDLIERLCIEAALELTGNNRASAAELLGLSRQSLYAKLRRHGMMEGGAES